MLLKRYFAFCSLNLMVVLLAVATGLRAETRDLTGDVWSVCGWDGMSTWHDTRLVFTNQSDGAEGVALEGYFDWQSNLGSTGREHFKGVLFANGDLKLQGYSLEDSRHIVNSRYEARLSGNGVTIVDGVWLDGLPGIWAAVRDGGTGTAARFCDQSDLLS